MTASDKIIEVLRNGPSTRSDLKKATGFYETTISRHLVALRNAGHIVEHFCRCPHCGAQGERLIELVSEPASKKPEKKVKKAIPKIKVPPPPARTVVKLPKHDGSVFGLMAAQLGA